MTHHFHRLGKSASKTFSDSRNAICAKANSCILKSAFHKKSTSSHNFVKMRQILWPRTAKRLGLGQKWKWFWKAWTMAFRALVVVKWAAAPPSGQKLTKRGNSPFWGFKNDEKTRFRALSCFYCNKSNIFQSKVNFLLKGIYSFLKRLSSFKRRSNMFGELSQ